MPKPIDLGQQSFADKIIGLGQRKQQRLAEQRRRLERAQNIDRQDLKTLYGFDVGALSDSFRVLFQQDVDAARKLILESDDFAAQQQVLADLQATWQWMSEHNNETVQAARNAMKTVAFSTPNQQRSASAGLDVGLEFDESPEHFAEVEMQFNNFFDPSKARKIDGVWMIEKDGQYVDIRELEGYGNAEVFSPRTRQVDLGTIDQWATSADVQRVLTLDGEFNEQRAESIWEQAKLTNKEGKEHRAQILATLKVNGNDPFTSDEQRRAFIEGVPMDKDDTDFLEAQAQAFALGKEAFMRGAKTEPTPDQKDLNRERYLESTEQTSFTDDNGFNHNGSVRSLVGFSDMVITDEGGSAIKVTPTHIYIDENNQAYLEYASISDTGDQKTHIVPLSGAQLSDIDLQMRAKHNVSVSDLYDQEASEGVTGPGSLDDIGLDNVPDPITETPEQQSTVEFQDLPSVQEEAMNVAMESVPEQPDRPTTTTTSGVSLPVDSPLVTKDSTSPDGTSGTSSVFEAVARNEAVMGELGMNEQQLAEFFSIPSVNEALKNLDLPTIGVGVDRPVLGSVLEGAFGWAGYKTAVTKSAEKIIEWMESPEGLEFQRRYYTMGAAEMNRTPTTYEPQQTDNLLDQSVGQPVITQPAQEGVTTPRDVRQVTAPPPQPTATSPQPRAQETISASDAELALEDWEKDLRREGSGVAVLSKSFGNLRPNPANPFASGTVNTSNGDYQTFDNYLDGLRGLIWDIKAKQEGRSRVVPAGSSIYQLISKYAPSEDSNNPEAYTDALLKFVNDQLNTNFDRDTKASEIPAASIAEAIASIEDPKLYRFLKQNGQFDLLMSQQ